MADFSIKITGHKTIIDQINQLPPKLQRKGATQAARRAMAPVRDRARADARAFDDEKSPERIWKNISIQNSASRGKRIGGVVMRVGVRGGSRRYANTKRNVREGKAGTKYKTLGDKSNPGGDTWYWRFLEFGTKKMAAQAFLLPALMNQAQSVWNNLYNEMQKVLER
ncbi:MAG: HK97 gp10 family phage protein, partial [Anaerolineae bacterium]|nr:HK97 gp10 family phage protein [Anaerolineae bacterium]